MIRLRLKDVELEARPDIRKWIELTEKKLNEALPEEKLAEIQKKIQYFIMTGEPYTIDSNGNVKGLHEAIRKRINT